jgi:hypothetical protein
MSHTSALTLIMEFLVQGQRKSEKDHEDSQSSFPIGLCPSFEGCSYSHSFLVWSSLFPYHGQASAWGCRIWENTSFDMDCSPPLTLWPWMSHLLPLSILYYSRNASQNRWYSRTMKKGTFPHRGLVSIFFYSAIGNTRTILCAQCAVSGPILDRRKAFDGCGMSE